MGPPKAKVVRKSYSELLKENDVFEYRWNKDTESYYLFNPYTGETIFQLEFELLDRSKSMWAPPDRVISTVAHTVTLYPEFYRSRSWGRRPFNGYDGDQEAAATHICAVTRGFLARRRLSNYYGRRYYTLICNFSGYKYFHDTENPKADTSWHKPRLAFPTDIQPYNPDDPEYYMKIDKYSWHNMNLGPVVARRGVGKSNVKRVINESMIRLNPWRDQAIRRPNQIDFEKIPMGTIIAWMDDCKAIGVRVDEYAVLRAACHGNNWDSVLNVMRTHPMNPLIQFYCLHCFAKMDVRFDVPDDPSHGNIMVDFAVAEVMKICIRLIKDKRKRNGVLTFRIFAMHVLKNIFSSRFGRVEFFTNNNPLTAGGDRMAAREAHVTMRINMFCKVLGNIKTETTNTSFKGSNEFIEIILPTPRSAYAVCTALECLCLLAEEQDTRELIATLAAEPVMKAMLVCYEQADVWIAGLKFLYNCCYYCEAAQNVIANLEFKKLFRTVHQNFHGEFEVERQCRRFELTMKKDGWRGFAESLIEREMRGERIPAEYLEDLSLETDEVALFLRQTRIDQMIVLAERAEAMEVELERQEGIAAITEADEGPEVEQEALDEDDLEAIMDDEERMALYARRYEEQQQEEAESKLLSESSAADGKAEGLHSIDDAKGGYDEEKLASHERYADAKRESNEAAEIVVSEEKAVVDSKSSDSKHSLSPREMKDRK